MMDLLSNTDWSMFVCAAVELISLAIFIFLMVVSIKERLGTVYVVLSAIPTLIVLILAIITIPNIYCAPEELHYLGG